MPAHPLWWAYSACIPQRDGLVCRTCDQRVGERQELDAVDRVRMSTQRVAASQAVEIRSMYYLIREHALFH